MSNLIHFDSASPAKINQRVAGGFVLMDVLISMLLFSVGVLALIGLQSAMTRDQTESKIRADASYLANELIGLLWTDAANVANYNEESCATQSNCKEWQDRVAARLPQGVGKVTIADQSSKTGDVTVTVSWTMPNGDSHKYVTQTTVARN